MMITISELARDLGRTPQRIHQIIIEKKIKVERHGTKTKKIIFIDERSAQIIALCLRQNGRKKS